MTFEFVQQEFAVHLPVGRENNLPHELSHVSHVEGGDVPAGVQEALGREAVAQDEDHQQRHEHQHLGDLGATDEW